MLIAATMPAGCVIPTLHPFQPAKPLPSELPQAEREPSIVAVRPVAGLAEPLATELADAMAASLSQRSLPAVVGATEPAVYTVAGRLGRNDGGSPVLLWELEDSEGRTVARARQPLPAPGDLEAAASRAALIAAIAGEPGTVIAKGIEGDAPAPAEPSRATHASSPAGGSAPPANASLPARAAATEGEQAFAGPAGPLEIPPPQKRGKPSAAVPHDGVTVSVAPAKGLPADGEITLRRAIAYALAVAKVEVAEERAPGSLSLVGNVAVAELGGELRHIKVTWSLRRPDGSEIGQVSQENKQRPDVLERAWSEIAAAVAENAAGGIAALVDQAQAKAP
jgi:hypothetical protein